MSQSMSVPPPAWGGDAPTPESVITSIETWLRNEPLATLVDAFGGRVPHESAAGTLKWLDDFSAEHWDFRVGQERNLARTADFDRATTDLILNTAAALGLTTSTPPARNAYDHVLILGGLVRACLLRPRFAAGLIERGLQTRSVAALSAYRPLRGDEHDLINALGVPDKRNEMEVMEAGLVEAFALGKPDDEQAYDEPGLEFATSLVRTWQASGLRIQLVIAPSPEPATRRANTADTYAYWADSCAHLTTGNSILLVTSSIYVPYQHADAVRLLALPHGCSVETVGIDFSDERLGALQQSFTPANYLQEIRSAIRATRALYAAASVAEEAAY